MEGFFDEAPAVGAKRPRDPDEEEEEPTQETEEMEEAGENEELDIDKIVSEAEAVEVMDLAALKRTMADGKKSLSAAAEGETAGRRDRNSSAARDRPSATQPLRHVKAVMIS